MKTYIFTIPLGSDGHKAKIVVTNLHLWKDKNITLEIAQNLDSSDGWFVGIECEEEDMFSQEPMDYLEFMIQKYASVTTIVGVAGLIARPINLPIGDEEDFVKALMEKSYDIVEVKPKKIYRESELAVLSMTTFLEIAGMPYTAEEFGELMLELVKRHNAYAKLTVWEDKDMEATRMHENPMMNLLQGGDK